jgi:hypothetical protein
MSLLGGLCGSADIESPSAPDEVDVVIYKREADLFL